MVGNSRHTVSPIAVMKKTNQVLTLGCQDNEDWKDKTMRDKTMRVFSCPCLLAVMFLFVSCIASSSIAQEKLTADEARAIAKEAYIFNYPLVMMYRTMYLQAIDKDSKSYSGGFGKWINLGTSSPKDTDIVSPNNDSPYSYAWVDLRAEPWVLTMPTIENNRFYTSQWFD